MTKKNQVDYIKEKILEILEIEGRAMSIREIRNILVHEYNINKSPQIIKRLLLLLKRERKID